MPSIQEFVIDADHKGIEVTVDNITVSTVIFTSNYSAAPISQPQAVEWGLTPTANVQGALS